MIDFLGTSAGYPLRPNGRGGLVLVSGPDAVRDSLRAILETWRGSALHEAWLGVPQFMFHPMPDLYAAALVIKEAIVFGEDRITEETLIVQASIGDEGLLRITITYQIRGEATSRTLEVGYQLPR